METTDVKFDATFTLPTRQRVYPGLNFLGYVLGFAVLWVALPLGLLVWRLYA